MGIITTVAVAIGVVLVLLFLMFPKITKNKFKKIPNKIENNVDKNLYMWQTTNEYKRAGYSEDEAKKKAAFDYITNNYFGGSK